MIAYLCTFIVGLVFLVTGVIKALSSGKFIDHIFQYQIFSEKIVQPIATTFIGIECALGTALIFHIFPQWIIPGTAILLALLSIVTLWSTSTGRTEDCGCYAGLAIITPSQSILLNLGYIALMGLAFYYPVANHETLTWQWITTLVVLGLGIIFAQQSKSEPLVDFSYLKEGKVWKKSWLKNSVQDIEEGNKFIVFLSSDCPYCKEWVPLLNIMQANPKLPQVIGIMTLSESEIRNFKSKHLVHFSITSINKILLNNMVEAFPTAVLLKDGRIDNISSGEMPQDFFKEIQHFYRATVRREEAKKSVRFAG
ncbi:MAG: thioredoxin family protein [Rivularia sp. ALOHA_DT_140]|nr:thioredoxin family protein [Rivularia sp. ALOHA_DT_140]